MRTFLSWQRQWRCLLTLSCLLVSGLSWTQTISLHLTNAPIKTAFSAIEAQTSLRFVYTSSGIADAKPVTLTLEKLSIDLALSKLFTDQPFAFTRDGQYVTVKPKPILPQQTQKKSITISGTISDEQKQPLPDVTVQVKGSTLHTTTDAAGHFRLAVDSGFVTVICSRAELITQEFSLKAPGETSITMIHQVGSLGETIVMGYGKTTRRLSVGNIAKVSAVTIERQPVTNVLSALQGRVAGLEVTQSSGVAGSTIKVQIRGRNSIAQGSQPLFILNGVPLAAGNGILNQLPSAMGNPGTGAEQASGLSPLVNINPADIESIEVLKDADATAIYGSRGANGVILITTRSGNTGAVRANVSFSTSWSRITRLMDLLNTQQYIAMRKEAFANDGASMTNSNAADLRVWDTTRYTDFKDVLIGGTARTNIAQASVSGGSAQTSFLFSLGYHDEGSVFPGELYLRRGAGNLQLQHRSTDQRFLGSFSVNYGMVETNNSVNDLTQHINLPPNAPPLFTPSGLLNWQENGVTFSNPLAHIMSHYTSQSEQLSTNALLQYRVIPGLTAKLTGGYNTIMADEESLVPIVAQNPANNPVGYSNFGQRKLRSWIIEPQLEYTGSFSWGRITALAGASWQSTINQQSTQQASGFSTDALLRSIYQARSVINRNGYTLYRYGAIFGRIQYDWQQEYLVSVSARRDGSSRFGPENRFANFGSIGAGWIFNKTLAGFAEKISLSFGKLRASYGSSGNDQLTDYQYLSSWSGTPNLYDNVAGLMPTRLYNPNQHWEVNKKLEAAIELGFFRDRLFLSVAWFRNRSDNQLVAYPLASQAGFPDVIQNLDALVQNTGVEVELRATPVTKGRFSWTIFGNLTIPRNKLLSFPELPYSSYSNQYVEGEPLSVLRRYRMLGVDPATGVYQFEDVNKDGLISSPDYQVIGNLDPKFYGGLGQDFSYGELSCSIFFEFRHQTGLNYLSEYSTARLPGRNVNQPILVLDRWQTEGDITNIQRFNAVNGRPSAQASSRLLFSSGMYSDASFVRLKNIAISYTIPARWTRTLHLQRSKVFVQAQNVLTFTGFTGSDPETQRFFRLPPLRTLACGIQLQF
jgi:TonB-linked SusC/RagA family outer membrane protein